MSQTQLIDFVLASVILAGPKPVIALFPEHLARVECISHGLTDKYQQT